MQIFSVAMFIIFVTTLRARKVALIFFQGQQGSSHLESLLQSNSLCSLGFEALDCYKSNCKENISKKNEMFRRLLKASQAISQDEYERRVDRVIEISREYNKHEKQLRQAKSCNITKSQAAFVKLRFYEGLVIPSGYEVYRYLSVTLLLYYFL